MLPRHPVIVKVSADQDYLTIARGLVGIAEAVSLNSVPWKTVFTNGEQTPLAKLEKQVGGGGGGVSGKPAQKHNWAAVEALAKQAITPVIGPSVMEFEDMENSGNSGRKRSASVQSICGLRGNPHRSSKRKTHERKLGNNPSVV